MTTTAEDAPREPVRIAHTGPDSRAAEILRSSYHLLHARTDRMFAAVMVVQWIFGVVCALILTPNAWTATGGSVQAHIMAAVGLGGLLAALPVWFTLKAPGEARTRYTIAICQGLFSALLIHLTGGRIETHFHVFVSLAFLSFYRDYATIALATAVVGADHVLRGLLWPESIFGITAPESWRWMEHVGWVVFENVVLISAVHRGRADLKETAEQQAQMEQTRSLIESEVEERTAELVLARDEAIRLAAAKTEFLANMSHEIRTPMNGVLGFVELLRQSELSPEQEDFVGTISGCGESLLTILNDILDFSKMEAGELMLETLPLEPEDLLDTVSHMLAASAAAKNVEFVCRTHSLRGMTVIGDPTRLQQVLLNICSNAIKFTPEGGEVLLDAQLVERADGKISLEISVTDTGIGIAPDRQEDLFLPFHQADTSMTRKYGGTGLGLSICQRIVELMDGKIEVESQEGVGTRFSIHLTLEEIATVKRTGSRLDSLRFLVVDDNATNRRLLEEILERAGAEFVSCDGAESALLAMEKAEPGHFTAGLLDFQMPNVDGLQLAKMIRDRFGDPLLPLILLTSVNGLRSSDLDDLGFLALQLKPIRSKALVQMLAHEFGDRKVLPAQAPARAKAEAPDGSTDELSVLLVEDNPVNMRLAKALLKRQGHTVTSACDGREAVEAFKEERFDIVVMDVQMPVMDGFVATGKMREIEMARGSRTPIVALTAHALAGYREECIAAGMDEYLTKPISTDELTRVFELVMQPSSKMSA